MCCPSPPTPPISADPLGDLHRFYDGRPPRHARLASLAGGEAILSAQRQAARDHAALTRCAAIRLAVARRRRQVAATEIMHDAWLCRLAAEMPAARAAAIAK